LAETDARVIFYVGSAPLQQNQFMPPSCAVLQVTGYCAWPGLVWSLDLCARFTWPDVVTTYEKGK
jgi:hypothetical protein